jgi:lactoylglutathione lyase
MLTQMNYAMVIVSDMNRSVEFYRDTLGVPLKFESPEWTEFNTGTTTLALHGGGVPQQHSGPPSGGKAAGSCSIGFNVPDLAQTYEELKAKGVRFVMPPTDQPENGIKLAVALDPDGLGISFAEFIKK